MRPFVVDVAVLLDFGNLPMGAGLLVVPWLARGRRGFSLAFMGLARAGVVGCWSIPAIIAGYAGTLFLPSSISVLPRWAYSLC